MPDTYISKEERAKTLRAYRFELSICSTRGNTWRSINDVLSLLHALRDMESVAEELAEGLEVVTGNCKCNCFGDGKKCDACNAQARFRAMRGEGE